MFNIQPWFCMIGGFNTRGHSHQKLRRECFRISPKRYKTQYCGRRLISIFFTLRRYQFQNGTSSQFLVQNPTRFLKAPAAPAGARVDLVNFNTLRCTKTTLLTPKRYDENPSSFHIGVPHLRPSKIFFLFIPSSSFS